MTRLWPSVDNVKAAESAALGATSACLLIAVTDLAIGITAMVTHHPAIGLDEWVIVDAIAFLTIGAYIFWKHSRVAAVMGLLLFSFTETMTWGCETSPFACNTSATFCCTCISLSPTT